MSETTQPEQNINEFYLKFRSNPTNSFINHKDIFSLLMSKIDAKDKLELINQITHSNPAFDNLKGLNKENVIERIVKPILANNTPEDIMAFKTKLNALKDASEAKYKEFVKTEKDEIKFIPAKVSSEEYVKFLVDNKNLIINAEKNESSVSSAMLLLAYHELKNKPKMHTILTNSGVDPSLANDFIKSGILEHNPQTNEIKKLVVRAINSNQENVATFKNLTDLTPTFKNEKENVVNKKI
jgi:hypothetical protein